MINDDSLARTAHALGMTDVEFSAREAIFALPPVSDIPPPPPIPKGVRPLPQIESTPEELSDWVIQDLLDGAFDD